MAKKIRKNKTNKDFLNCLKNFLKHVNGLQKAIEVSMLIATSLRERENNKIKEFIDKNGKDLKITKGVRKFRLDIQQNFIYKNLINEEEKSAVAVKLIPRSIFISLVSQFDLLVADMMKAVLIKYPAIISKEKTLTFEEALNLKSFNELREYFISNEIDEVLRGNHIRHIDWFEKKIKIKLKDSLGKKWQSFVELTERRNLFVHADGIVNDTYINNCKNYGVELDKNLKKGEILYISPEYFKNSYNCLYEIAVKLSWLVWRKMETKDIEEIDTFFNTEIGVELISQKEYQLSENIFSFILDNCKESSDLLKSIFLINLALTKKSKGNIIEAKNILNTRDWSASRIELRFVVHVLLKEFKEALILMEKIGKGSDLINRESYETDPVYKELRETSDFKKVFKKIYGEEYVSRTDNSDIKSIKDKPTKKHKN